MRQFHIIIKVIVLTLYLFGTTRVYAQLATTFLGAKEFHIDRPGLVIKNNNMGIGISDPQVPLQVSGNARVLYVGATPQISTNPAINWGAGRYQFVEIDSAVTVNITFTDPAGPSTLLLLMKRGIGVAFPSSVRWKGNANMTFPKPAVGVTQYDAVALIFDGSGYIGEANVDFKVPAVNPFGI
jgi:hypothetical protein